ncbi:MAG: hypothetical protein PHP94_02505 [Eubacteriales bacterium]|nr:hypothetical protein [Eubacteriales bacterium]
MKTADRYQNFRAALYIRALDIAPLGDDITPMTRQFEKLNEFVGFGKVYLETHRDMVVPEKKTLLALKEWFQARGLMTSAGITVTIDESANFKTYCYSDPFYRNRLKELVEFSASLFDEIVFDDFFFNNCKCPRCIEARGDRSWTAFRLELMTAASQELVLAPARAVNPKVQVVIKYPNWYEHFQGLGFNLKEQPPLYDGIYTGNETRDGLHDAQHLQPYESYQVFRYYENIKPGGNRGGWVDPFGSTTLDRYAEQLWLTLLAKSPEITLFDYHSIQMPVRESQRGAWQGGGTSFSFDGTMAAVRREDGTIDQRAGHAVAAGAALNTIDRVLPQLGRPIGVDMVKPYHSQGDDFLVNYLGMIGLPMNLVPEFPQDAQTVVLARSAAADPQIIDKIRAQLMKGGQVVITSGLLEELQDQGLDEIVEMRCSSRKMLADEFQMGWNPQLWHTESPILVPVIEFLTNDSWPQISCNCGAAGTPLLHSADYGNGTLFVLTIPDNPADLYKLPAAVLERIARTIAADMPVHLEAPGLVSLFMYDNNTFVVHSFRDEPIELKLQTNTTIGEISNLSDGTILTTEEVPGFFGRPSGRRTACVALPPHSFKVFRI